MTTVYVIDKRTGDVLDWRTLPDKDAETLARLWRVTRSQHEIRLQRSAPQSVYI